MEDRYLSYGQAYLFSDGRIGMVNADDLAENPITQETDTLGTRIYLWERRRSSPSRDNFESFSGMLEAYGVEETGDSEEDFYHLSLEALRRGEQIYPVGIYEHSFVRYYLDSVTDRNQTIEGVAILDKKKIGELTMQPEDYLKEVLETLTDWTNGEVYRVDMFIPKIALDGEDVFAKLVPDTEDTEHPRELYAPRISDLTGYLPEDVGISCLIGETFYSTDALRNYIEEPENGMYREIQKFLADRALEKEREPHTDRQEISGTSQTDVQMDSGISAGEGIWEDYANRLKRALSLPPAVSEKLLQETLLQMRKDADRQGFREVADRIQQGADGRIRETARSVLLMLQSADQKQQERNAPGQEIEGRKRQDIDI